MIPDGKAWNGVVGIRQQFGALRGPCGPLGPDGQDITLDLPAGGMVGLIGPDGVGKSSLLNRIQPGLGRRVGEVSEKVQKGRHTTVTAELIELDCGGFVADTPGLRELGLWGIEPEELDLCFPEFRPYLSTCRYGNSCSHTHEPGCAIRDAVSRGAVLESRYDSYRRMFEGEEE